MKRSLLALAILTASACSGGSTTDTTGPTAAAVSDAPTAEPTATVSPSSPTPDAAPTATPAPPDVPPRPAEVPRISVTGPEEIVFDWTVDRCQDEHIPDIAARAFRDADGQVQLIVGHYVTYRMIGPELDEVVTDCTGPLLVSDFDPDPSQFNDSEWIGSPYTLDGETIYAVVHNEYRGDTHTASRPGQCPSRERLTCLDTSLTMVVSTDGGDTYDDILPPPNHLIATLPYTFDDEGVPSGLRQPSNIIRGPDDYFYVFSNISDYPDERQWVCLMRTDDLTDPSSWRFWDGTDFAGRFLNPYVEPVGPETEKCAPLAEPQLSGSVNETIVFDETLQRYILTGVSSHPFTEEPRWAVYYALSEDLIEWSSRELLLELPTNPSVGDPANDLFHAYPAIIDPDSTSPNFETTNGDAYLYLARLNAGGNSLDRDLIRWPIEMSMVELAAPEWNFDTDGDTEGWFAENALTPLDTTDGKLTMQSTGEDPYLASGPLRFPAGYDRIVFRMRVSGDSTLTGQLFFGTEADPFFVEDASVLFDVIADGEYHNYELDLSSIAAWEGTIVSLRLDPIPDADRTIEIDRIGFPSS